MRRIKPPIWLLIAILMMATLHFGLPMYAIVPVPINWGGAVLIGLGSFLAAWPARQFHAARTTIIPFRESSTLITTGPYRVSRNPIYLSMVLLLLGIAIQFGSLTPLLVVPVFALLIDRVFICGEEPMLQATFGDEYRRYCQRVRRWI